MDGERMLQMASEREQVSMCRNINAKLMLTLTIEYPLLYASQSVSEELFEDDLGA
jgi:hypothetical protein